MKQVQVTAKSPTAFPRGVLHPKGLRCSLFSAGFYSCGISGSVFSLFSECTHNSRGAVHFLPVWNSWSHAKSQIGIEPFSHQTAHFRTLFQVMPLGQRSDEMHNVSGMMSSPVANQSGVNSSFSSTFMDETDDYMDYMGGGGSPLGLSSESSNQDRSCTSTPVGNDGSPAGELISVTRWVN